MRVDRPQPALCPATGRRASDRGLVARDGAHPVDEGENAGHAAEVRDIGMLVKRDGRCEECR
jgi:hypothetical protein